MIESLPDSDTILAQFNRLVQELLRGSLNRNTFRPWEIELLLDIEMCEFGRQTTLQTLGVPGDAADEARRVVILSPFTATSRYPEVVHRNIIRMEGNYGLR
jgi:hypothetical protein